MPSKALPKHPVARMPLWKVVLLGLFLSGFVSLMSALAPAVVEKPFSFSPTMWDITIGGTLLVLILFHRWTWGPRRKHGRWLRWFANVATSVYVSLLFLLPPILLWNILVRPPWNWIVNGVSIALFVLVWVLPAISERAAGRIAYAQDTLGLKMLRFGTPAGLMVTAGILGANFGLHGGPSPEAALGTRLVFIALLGPPCAIAMAQYFADYFWPYRPWQKDEKT